MSKCDSAIHPCIQIIQTNGVAVGHLHRYPRDILVVRKLI